MLATVVRRSSTLSSRSVAKVGAIFHMTFAAAVPHGVRLKKNEKHCLFVAVVVNVATGFQNESVSFEL